MNWFKQLLISIDPDVTKHVGDGKNKNYTVWSPYGENDLMGDGSVQDTVHMIQVDRFTKEDDESLAQTLKTILKNHDLIICEYKLDYEEETGYYHHIYDCEVCDG